MLLVARNLIGNVMTQTLLDTLIELNIVKMYLDPSVLEW